MLYTFLRAKRRVQLLLVLTCCFILLALTGGLGIDIGPDHLSFLLANPSETIRRPASVATYLDAILHKGPALPVVKSFHCPAINTTRYSSLQATDLPRSTIRYYFALNLRQCLPLLPRLMGSIIEVMQFLGPQYCALSIVEGMSPDGTATVLAALGPHLEAMGITYFFETSYIDTHNGDRIRKLADLRNLALDPLIRHANRSDENTTVVFLNDVAACPEDILELTFQRKHLGADMTCAMDWTNPGRNARFYDVWVARDITGDTFWKIPPRNPLEFPGTLFEGSETSESRFLSHRPFQVFACWNGGVTFGAQPIIQGLRFRASNQEAGECLHGEPQLFCKDLWFRGHGKIAVVPTVNFEYTIEDGKKLKKTMGYTSELLAKQDLAGDKIDWQIEPPELVKCMPDWADQSWRPWNETLGVTEHNDGQRKGS